MARSRGGISLRVAFFAVAILSLSPANAPGKEHGAKIPASWLDREGDCINHHRHEHWPCFMGVMEGVPKDAPWRANFEYLGRGLWRLDVANDLADGLTPPKAPPNLPKARGLDRILECGDSEEYHRSHVKCFDHELPAARREAPFLRAAQWHRRLAELRAGYAKLDAAEALTDAIFKPTKTTVRSPSQGQVLAEFEGVGAGATRPFTANGSWEAQFTAQGYFGAYLMSADGQMLNVVANIMGGHSSYYSPVPGTYYFNINTGEPWRVRVVRVKQ